MTRDDFDHRGWFEQTIQREAPIVAAALRWRKHLDVAPTGLNEYARALVEAIDARPESPTPRPGPRIARIDPIPDAAYHGHDVSASSTGVADLAMFKCMGCGKDVCVAAVKCSTCKAGTDGGPAAHFKWLTKALEQESEDLAVARRAVVTLQARLDERTPGQQATDYGFAAERDRQLVASRAEAKREVERLRGELTRERAKVAALANRDDSVLQSRLDVALRQLDTVLAERDSLRAKVHGAQADARREEQRAIDVEAERDALLVTVRMMARAT